MSDNTLARDYDAAHEALLDVTADFREYRRRIEDALARCERITPEGPADWVDSGVAMRSTVIREIRSAVEPATH